jgi:Family of unknown function (DUF6427)
LTPTFKANNPYNTFLLFFYGLLLKLPMFLQPKTPLPQQVDGFLFRGLLKFLEPLGKDLPIIYPLLAFFLLFTQAITFNRQVSRQRLLNTPNYLTGMSYLLLTSLFSEWNMLSAPLLINSLLLWIWARMSSLQNAQNPRIILFNLGVAISLCTFFYFPSMAFAALIIFGLLITRPFNLNEWLVALIGIITPYYFLFSFIFLNDLWQKYVFPGFSITAPRFVQTNWAFPAIAVVLIAVVTGFFMIQKNFRRQLIQARKSWNLIFLYLVIAIFVPFVNATHSFEYWILCAIPLSALMAGAFFYPEKNIFPRLLHWVMVALIITTSYLV